MHLYCLRRGCRPSLQRFNLYHCKAGASGPAHATTTTTTLARTPSSSAAQGAAAAKAALRKKQQADDPPPGLSFTPAALKLGLPEIINVHGKRSLPIVPHSASEPSRAAAAATLGVKENAADRTIERTYKRLMLQIHPDKAKTEEERKENEKRTKEVTEAITKLMRKSGPGRSPKSKRLKMPG